MGWRYKISNVRMIIDVVVSYIIWWWKNIKLCICVRIQSNTNPIRPGIYTNILFYKQSHKMQILFQIEKNAEKATSMYDCLSLGIFELTYIYTSNICIHNLTLANKKGVKVFREYLLLFLN